jgi:hypothetical protein
LSQDQLESLVAQLDSNRFAVRESATEQLLALGPQVVPMLAVVSRGESLEAADRAVWILDRLAQQGGRETERQSLEALLGADRFPAVQSRASARLTELYEEICGEQFARLGGSLTIKHPFDATAGIVTQAVIDLGVDWQGDQKSLEILRDLRELHTVEISGSKFDDSALEPLGAIKSLRQIKVTGSSVSPSIVSKLKSANPDLRIAIEHDSMVGVMYMPMGNFVISDVQPGSPADQAGLAPGDVITKFEGTPIDSFDLLTAHVSQHRPGTSIALEVQRGETVMDKTIRLAARPNAAQVIR